MKIELKYGCNPNQKHANIIMNDQNPPLKILNGVPSYINILDGLGSYQLSKELFQATNLPSAASFKHVSPAGAAVSKPISEIFRISQMLPSEDLSPLALAYARARCCDRMCSYGDFVGVSHKVDISLAKLLKAEVSDGIIAPGYDKEALEILKSKKKGNYVILEIDPFYEPMDIEKREVFGISLEQNRNTTKVTRKLFSNIVTKESFISEQAYENLVVATITLKYTQSNSICVAYDGQAIGIGAGQQSRIHCTRLACDKSDKWFLLQHPKVLNLKFKNGLKIADKAAVIDQYILWSDLSDAEENIMLSSLEETPIPLTKEEKSDWISNYKNIVLSSDAFIPFRDNIDRAQKSGIKYILQTGGAIREQDVIDAADQYGMLMINSGIRWFLH